MHTEAELTQEDLVELWQALADEPDSPERYEITERGETVMSPRPAGRHQME